MLAWVEANGGVRAVGEAGSVSVATSGWTDRPGAPALSTRVEEAVSGTVTGLSLPVREASLVDGTGRRRADLGAGAVVSDGPTLLECRFSPDGRRGRADGGMSGVVRFEGPAKVAVDDGTARVQFPEPTPVRLGFRERVDDPATVTVPPTPEGVATAVTHLSAALRTTDPGRSHPSLRDHPPVVETGEAASIPDAVAEAVPETGVELRLPASLEYLLVGAPLAYYLGADVTVSDREAPALVAPDADVWCDFRELPTFQHGVADLLRRVFFFDTLVRDVDGEDGSSHRAREFGLEPERVRTLSPAARLARYFHVTGDVDAALPEWHFSTYAAPGMRSVRSLPYLLDALSLVYLPAASELGGRDLLERTLDDCYRSSHARPVPSVDVVQPERRAGRIHAWQAPGTPIDAFKTMPAAHEHRRRYRDRSTPLSVAVVLNDDAMADEHAAVADIYRERAADLPLEVSVREHLTTDELAAVFTAPHDFVHYIGHCDVDGLECADGNLAATDLDRVRARTFFLNACGSYHEGRDLVERGSVAGAVTLTKVLDRQAATVGTAFARLLVHGFGLEPAMQLSRRRIMMGKDYVVVGDGTYTLAPTPDSPVVGWLEATDGAYRLTCEALTARRIGDRYRPPFGDEDVLHGTRTAATFGADELVSVLEEASLPVIYDDEFHWSDDLANRLATGERG